MMPRYCSAGVAVLFGAWAMVGVAHAQTVPCRTSGSYEAWLTGLEREATAQGVSQRAVAEAAPYLKYDQRIINIDHGQRVFTQTFLEFSSRMAAAYRISGAQARIKKYASVFERIDKEFGVPAAVISSFWGLESDFGANQGKYPSLSSIASLAYDCRRADKFRPQLIDALRLIQRGDLRPAEMQGSWAGELGQTQMMPSEYNKYAVDYDNNGKRDLIHDVPDVLGSTANYLRKEHWQHGLPWGFEVSVPKGFDYRRSHGSFAEWAKLGVRRADGEPFPASGPGILFFPSGANGPAFIATENYAVLKEYNNSDAYAIAVGHLADRMQGGPPIKAAWPADDRPLSRDARIALQKKLSALGYKVLDFEGHIDFDLRDNVRAEQAKLGMLPDGNPTAAFLERLGVKAP